MSLHAQDGWRLDVRMLCVCLTLACALVLAWSGYAYADDAPVDQPATDQQTVMEPAEPDATVVAAVASEQEARGESADEAQGADVACLPSDDQAAQTPDPNAELATQDGTGAPADGGEGQQGEDPVIPELPKGAVQVEEGTYVLQSEVAPDRVLDAAGVNPVEGAAVATWAYNGGGNQAWDVERDEESGWYRLVVHHAANDVRLCLGLKAGTGDTCLVREGAKGVSLRELLWSFVTAGGESLHLVNAAHPGKALDVYGNSPDLGARLILWDAKNDSSKNQSFVLCERYPDVAPSDVTAEGSYNLVLQGMDRMVDVSGASRDNGADVLLWCGNGGRNQRVYLEEDGTGYHIVWMIDSGKVLDVAGGSVLRGTNVLQWEYKGSDNQKWALHEGADGSLTLQNKGTGLVLGVRGTALGTSVAGVGANDTKARTAFALKQASLVDAGSYVIRPRINTQLALDVDHASTGSAGVLLWLDTGALNQRFEMVAEREGLWRVRTASSGGWLTLVGGALRQEGDGATPANDANTWRVRWHKGAMVLVNVSSGTAIDPFFGKAQPGVFVASAPVGTEAAQLLAIDPAPLLSPGCYFFGNDYGKYLEVEGLSIAEGANVQLGNRTGSYGQLFRIEPSGSSCRIINVLSGKALEAAGTASTLNVSQRSVSGSSLQLWTMRIADGGHVRFESAANPAVSLDAWGGGAVPTNVGTFSNNVSTAQAWRPVALPPETMTGWQARAVASAHNTPSTAGGLCALWVSNVFRNAGIGSWDGDARDLYSWYCHSNDLTALRPGMIVAVSSHGHTWAGGIWGHVCIYIGNGMIMDSVGQKRTMALSDWAAWYGDRVTVRWGWIGGRAL